MTTGEKNSDANTEMLRTKSQKAPATNLFAKNDLLLWPYKSLSKALIRTQHDFSIFIEVNRKLADEMREIVRREQDLVMQISEKMLERISSTENSEGKPMLPAAEIEEIYDSAVAGIRELGKAVADAQIRSIESLRARARSALSQSEPDEETSSKAA
jgi:hypothetical protein